jgi:hypothetical protein
MPDAPVVVVGSPDATTTAAAEATASAAVEIAQIEADRAVAIETIAAETARIGIEASTAENEDDVAWLRAELASLRGQCEMNAAGLSSLEAAQVALSAQVGEMASGLTMLVASSTPLPPSETPPETPPQEAPQNALEGGEGGQRASQEAPDETPPAARRQRRRWL